MTETTKTPLPRTDEQILAEIERRRKNPFDFGVDDLILALPFEKVRPFLKDDFTGSWEPCNTVEAVKAEMANYAEFAWGKVAGHRGISSGRNLDHYASWCWLLGDDETVAFIRDNKNYPMYGAPALAYVCKKYGLEVPDDPETQNMIKGRACTSDCHEGCGR